MSTQPSAAPAPLTQAPIGTVLPTSWQLTAILPCPFCGSANVSHGEALVKQAGVRYKQSVCMDCGAHGPQAILNSKELVKDLTAGDDKAAIEWNRRILPAAISEVVEALKALLEHTMVHKSKADLIIKAQAALAKLEAQP